MCLETISCISFFRKCCTRDDDDDEPSKLELYRLHITRLSYGLFLVFGFLLALIGRNGFFGLMEYIPVIKQGCNLVENEFSTSCAGKNVVYRMSFSLFIFFFMNLILSSRLFCVGDRIRLYIQHKWFILKIPIFLILILVPYFIPNEFFIIWAWIALFMAGIFIIIQIILLIDFGFNLDETWRSNNIQEEGLKFWDYVLLLISFSLILITIVLMISQFIIFGFGLNCHLNRLFIILNIIFSVFTIVSSLVFKRGIVPPSIIVVYCTFLCWSSCMSNPDKQCNLFKLNETTDIAFQIITSIIGGLFASFSLLYSSITTSKALKNLFAKKSLEDDDEGYIGLSEEDLAKEQREECQEIFHSHIVFIFASFYLCMILVSWSIDVGEHTSWKIEESIAAVWVKITSSWITYLIFFWTLIAPFVLGKCRKFAGYNDNEFD
eukprot:gene8423-248_t